ncbi:MAG: histidinol-phosphate transaminase [Pseudomonadota bacterium]|nr:histidinol-phosphate transaminase [Pseudomonadota bacterium]
MSNNTTNQPVALPRATLANKLLVRPDWTVAIRNTANVIALDKNETTDPIFKEQLATILSTIPVHAVTEYPECAPYYHFLARKLDITPKNLLFTHGSDGAIRFVFEAYASHGDIVMMTAPSFAMYQIYAKIIGAKVIELKYEPSDIGPTLNIQTICTAIEKNRPKLFCLPNPDSPTGTIFSLDELESIIEVAATVGTIFLVDEAYFPFSDVTAIGLIDRHSNLVVTRTFAKAWGLAGLRLGFAAAHPDLISVLHKIRPMYEVNGFALNIMEKILDHEDWVMASVKRAIEGKNYFINRMNDIGFYTLDGAGNFLHVKFGKHSKAVHAALDGKVLYKRDFNESCLKGYSRFSAAPEKIMSSVSDLIEGALV